MKHKYAPTNRNSRLAHLQCELTEASHAIAKINRWGAHSTNSEKPKDPIENPSNIAELLLEMWDVDYATNMLMPDIIAFLGADYVKQLREHWLAQAMPPPAGPTGPTGSVGPMVTCPSCGGAKHTIAQLDEKRVVKETCQVCGGRGLVAPPSSPGESETTDQKTE